MARHPAGVCIAVAALLLFIMISAGLSSCGSMFSGLMNGIVGTSYTSEDSDLVATENNYAAKENELQQRIDNIERDNPGYDEYRYDLDSIGHNPHELASYLTALFQTYTPQSAQAEINRVFDMQYTLTLTEEIEVRHRTETRTGTRTVTDPETGETSTETYEYEVDVAYNYYILNVKLTNKPVSEIAEELLTPEQLEMYRVYLETSGNKPLIFGGGSPDTRVRGFERRTACERHTPRQHRHCRACEAAGRKRGRAALLELVRLQQPRGMVRLFRFVVLRTGGAIGAALCRVPVTGRTVVPVTRAMGCEGLCEYRPRRRYLFRLGRGRERRPCGACYRNGRGARLYRRGQFRRRLQDKELSR